MVKQLFILPALLSGFAISPVNSLGMDIDHDSVPDSRDRCPNTAQLTKLPADFKFTAAVNPERLKPGPLAYPVDQHGCEFDTDGDGVVNSEDYCPEDSKEVLLMGVAGNGCPKHSDRDGTPDYRDRCPNTPAKVKTDKYGCEASQKILGSVTERGTGRLAA